VQEFSILRSDAIWQYVVLSNRCSYIITLLVCSSRSNTTVAMQPQGLKLKLQGWVGSSLGFDFISTQPLEILGIRRSIGAVAACWVQVYVRPYCLSWFRRLATTWVFDSSYPRSCYRLVVFPPSPAISMYPRHLRFWYSAWASGLGSKVCQLSGLFRRSITGINGYYSHWVIAARHRQLWWIPYVMSRFI
jgi:hypothetical protein